MKFARVPDCEVGYSHSSPIPKTFFKNVFTIYHHLLDFASVSTPFAEEPAFVIAGGT